MTKPDNKPATQTDSTLQVTRQHGSKIITVFGRYVEQDDHWILISSVAGKEVETRVSVDVWTEIPDMLECAWPAELKAAQVEATPIHKVYAQLSDERRKLVDACWTATAHILTENGVSPANDDGAERLVEAIAVYLTASPDLDA